MSTYPKADTTTQWWDDDYGYDVIVPNVAVVHTTEGLTWPGYDGGAKAPHVTGRPDFVNKRLRWRQHFPDEHSSRALVNQPGGVPTNTSNALQVELIGTCDDRLAKTWTVGTRTYVAGRDYLHWPTAPDWALREVADLFAYWASKHKGLPLRSTVTFSGYPYGASTRLTGSAWLSYYGFLGHQHVPENDHRDPGSFPIQRVLDMARGTTTPVPEEDDMPYTPDELADAVWTAKSADRIEAPADNLKTFPDNPKWTPASYLRYTYAVALETKAAVGALSGVVAQLATGQVLTAEEITAAAMDGASQALATLTATVTVTPGSPDPAA